MQKKNLQSKFPAHFPPPPFVSHFFLNGESILLRFIVTRVNFRTHTNNGEFGAIGSLDSGRIASFKTWSFPAKIKRRSSCFPYKTKKRNEAGINITKHKANRKTVLNGSS
uniref:(northern house mosquito) hypothetical protein n=1 Tax=Culex pipiens TaxID=7175 RepID=A0A8D8G1S0_CULPI